MLKFTIQIPPVTKKNSGQIIKAHGHPMIIPSKQYREYEKNCAVFLPHISAPIAEPVCVKAIFYMPTRRKCDLTNLLEAVDDVLVSHKILADDNYSVIVHHDGSRVRYDKEHPRTEIEIFEVLPEFD